jgi:hypothetical protein
MRRLNLAVVAAIALSLSTPALADGFDPGAWEHRTTMVSAEVPGVPQWVIKLFAGNADRKNCYTAQQAATRPETLLTQDDAAICTKRVFSMVGGKLVYDTFCVNKRFPDGLLVVSKGTYTPDSYAISTLSTGMRDGRPVRIVTTGAGHRTGACS